LKSHGESTWQSPILTAAPRDAISQQAALLLCCLFCSFSLGNLESRNQNGQVKERNSGDLES
jgi:hypothetical protein